MTKQQLITKVSKMDYPQKLERGWESSCPCFNYNSTINGVLFSSEIYIHGHCWRTTGDGLVGGCRCLHNGLHIKGNLHPDDLIEIGMAFKKQLDKQEWCGEWELVYEK